MLAPALTTALAVARLFGLKLIYLFVSVGSIFSAASLLCAFGVAAGVVLRSRRRGRRRVKVKVVLRALFPCGLWRRPTTRADVGFFLFNVLLAGGLTGGAILSAQAVQGWAEAGLGRIFGTGPLVRAPVLVGQAVTTAALFLAFEFAYYVDHWLSHHVPALWALHKPHHTAEALTPLTTFRVHPLESLKFLNIAALCAGCAGAVCAWAFGGAHEAVLDGRNVIFLGLWLAFGHLQHSNLWITFPGAFSRALISPAHHQLHHSADPRHYGKNLGSFLSVFDWLFGTLHHPTRERERLVFGVEGQGAAAHTVTGGLVDPVREAIGALQPPPAAPAPYAPWTRKA